MFGIWTIAAFWIGLALVASVASIWLGTTTALCEIAVGVIARFVIGSVFDHSLLDLNSSWISFLSGAGAMALAFLAGAEIDPKVLKTQGKSALTMGLAGFVSPFLGCTFLAHFVLGWSSKAAWLAGIALSTTSVAVVYSVMLDSGLNGTSFGKTVLAACFINGLGTILALGALFSPFSWKTALFLVAGITGVMVLPPLTRVLFERYGGRTREFEVKFLLLCLFGLGALAVWAGNEAVLPAYVIGVALARIMGRNHGLLQRVRSLAFGLLAPFYFIRAGSLVSISAPTTAPYILCALLAGKMAAKFIAIYPATRALGIAGKEGMYATLLMSTGLTFGSISAMFGLSHGIIDARQYSFLVATVLGSAVLSTFFANAFWMPKHLVHEAGEEGNQPPEFCQAPLRDESSSG